jgi:hypothetical protein
VPRARYSSGRDAPFTAEEKKLMTPATLVGSPLTTAEIGIPVDERFATLEELMRSLELVTSAEREHVMNRMLIILRREALGLDAPISAADLASLSNAITELEHEAGRFAPVPRLFNRNVESAIGALRRTATAADSPRLSAPAGCAAREHRLAA